MSKKIENLYFDKKFDLALFYFKERGITFVNDLSSFDFNELMFVPRITNEIILEMKEIYQYYINTNTVSDDKSNNKTFQPISEAALTSEDIKTSSINQKKDKLESIHTDNSSIGVNAVPAVSSEYVSKAVNRINTTGFSNLRIVDIYKGVPRSAPFVNHCLKHGKTFINQLSVNDFEDALKIKGLGLPSVQVLLDIYKECTLQKPVKNSSLEIYSDNLTNNNSVENIFKNLKNGKQFIKHCNELGIDNILDLKNITYAAAQLNGINSSYINKLLQNYLEFSGFSDINEKTINDLDIEQKTVEGLDQIPQENKNLSVRYLSRAGITQLEIQVLIDNNFTKVIDLCNKVIPQSLYSIINKSVPFLTIPFTSIFINKLNSLKETSRKIIVQKCQGDTLQKIGDEIGITRERVRQIIVKSCRYLMNSAEVIAEGLISYDAYFFTYKNIEDLFEDSIASECCKYVLTESNNFVYLNFSDKFIRKNLCPKNIETTLQQFSSDIIGDSMNFYDNLEIIESELPKYSLEFLDFEDIMNYLAKTGYHFYGEFVTRGKQSYALVCYDAVLKYFSFDIKLDSDENNEDIKYLRKIINKHYNGLKLPESGRALTARLAEIMILSGRGRYCPIEKVIYSPGLLEDVYNYIEESKQSTFYYSELFALFQGRLLAETNITNPNFLHGMLKYAYPDDFNYERDLMVKKGTRRQEIDERICGLIISSKGPVSKLQIKEAFPGINDFVITFVISRVPELIQWDYSEYNHILNITCDSNDLNNLTQVLEKYIKRNNGYLSNTIIYNAVKFEFPKFILKNKIKNSSNLFYILQYYFSNKYRFKFPHILNHNFPVTDIKTSNIAKTMLMHEKSLKYSSFIALGNSLGWTSPTLYTAFSELTRNYVRISDDEYIHSSLFNFLNDFLNDTKKQIYKLIESSGYYAVANIFSYVNFPICQFEWNGFLLESIIEEYDIGFKIVKPQVNERRYQKGIILSKNVGEMSFEDLVISMLQEDKINKLTEIELQKYLRNKGLINNLLPQELYECERLPFKNEIFTVKI